VFGPEFADQARLDGGKLPDHRSATPAATVTTSVTTTYNACHPLGHDHLNLLGRYQFSAPDLPDGQLRALRDPAT